MSIEEHLDKLTAALDNFSANFAANVAKALAGLPASDATTTASAASTPAATPAAETTRRGPGRPRKEDAPAHPSADKVKEIATKHMDLFGKPATKALIAKCGAVQLKDLTPAQGAEFVKLAEPEIAEKENPPAAAGDDDL